MGRVVTAFRAFFGSLFNGEVAARVDRALRDQEAQPISLPAPKPEPMRAATPPPAKHEALVLLSTLQREARLVDFLKEDLANYSDEQVGAAVREIHRDTGKVLERFFAVRPILTDEEGASVEVPKGFDAARYRLTGKLAGDAPFRGALRHHGWAATQSELPAFTGNDSSAMVVAPAEIELT
jgi:hypothetical protein